MTKFLDIFRQKDPNHHSSLSSFLAWLQRKHREHAHLVNFVRDGKLLSPKQRKGKYAKMDLRLQKYKDDFKVEKVSLIVLMLCNVNTS